MPLTFPAFGPAALTGRVAALARRYDRIAIKLPDSAGSAGNLSLDSADILISLQSEKTIFTAFVQLEQGMFEKR